LQQFIFEPVTSDERPSSLLNLRTGRVCEPCNIGWMHRLEDQAKPLLEDAAESGGQLELSRADALVVARWALKTAVTHELTNDRPKVADVQIGARLRTGKLVRGSATLATSVPTHLKHPGGGRPLSAASTPADFAGRLLRCQDHHLRLEY
jgi:hypothetical protein